MQASVNILDFDGVYHEQDYFKESNYKWVNLLDVKNANRYCEQESLETIDSRIKSIKNNDITFIGSGNYHYVSYLLIEEIKEPFTLVLFDHHTDMMEPPCSSLLTCGSWVLKSLESLEMLKKVIIIGIRSDLTNSIPEKFKDRVTIFSEEEIGQASINKEIEKEIISDNVYISIDKDVLSKSDALTNWDQGKMHIDELVILINNIAKNSNICGVDVCGEYTQSPIDIFSKEGIEAKEINNESNFQILSDIEEILNDE